MAVSLILLEIKKAPGDSTVANYKDHIAVESFDWNVKATLIEKTTDDPVTKVDAGAVSISKRFDRSSTVLRKMMDEDDPFTATLRFLDPTSRNADGKIDLILEIQLTGCHIDSISLDAGDEGKEVKVAERLVISYTTSASLSYRSHDRVSKTRGRAMTVEIPPSEKEDSKT